MSTRLNPQAPLEGSPDTGDSDWLNLAKQAWEDSEDYLDSSIRPQLEHSIAIFQSRHPQGSKYHGDAYKKRSRLVRPKTRAMVRRGEAACAAAFFSTSDVVSIEPENPDDPLQDAGAKVTSALIESRLANTIPWFITVCGAFQDADVQGVVISKQFWSYKERIEYAPVPDELGEPVMDGGTPMVEERIEVVEDKPKIQLIPVERIRIDPASDWTNPMASTPYIIYEEPMYAGDVVDRAASQDPKTGAAVWRPVTLEEVIAHASNNDQDTTRKAREKGREDSTDVSQGNEFQVVWVREVIMRRKGRDWIFYTLGDDFLLSDPQPLEEVYLHGRPFHMGYNVVETHKTYPESNVYIARDIQAAANDIQNQRFDNVRQVLNKRWLVRRNNGIDMKTFMNNVTGGVIAVDNPQTDVNMLPTSDVTQSSYAEQDRLNMDYDEITGTFSNSSVQANRMLNETVGGMEMMNAGANAVTEYKLRIFAETWVEPVLKQLVRLEREYETDEHMLLVAGQKAQVMMHPVLLEQDSIVRVNVGMGATNPQERINKFMMAINTVGGFPEMQARVNQEEVAKEIFGRLGYRDGARFLLSEQEMAEKQPPGDPAAEAKMQSDQMRMQLEQGKMQIEMQRLQLEQGKIQMDSQAKQYQLQDATARWQAELQMQREIALAKLAMEQGISMPEMYAKLQIEAGKLRLEEEDMEIRKFELASEAENRALDRDMKLAEMASRQQEMQLRRTTGAGI